jgi:hypothetical protein
MHENLHFVPYVAISYNDILRLPYIRQYLGEYSTLKYQCKRKHNEKLDLHGHIVLLGK